MASNERLPSELDCTNLEKEWPMWKQTFLMYMVANGKDKLPENQKIATFLWLIGPRAMDIYNTLYPNNGTNGDILHEEEPAEEQQKKQEKSDQYKLKDILKSFDDYCTLTKNVAIESFKFNMIAQKEKQSFAEFEAELRKQLQFCNYKCECGKLYEERMLRDRIIIGVHNKNLQLKLLAGNNESLKEVIETSRVFEAANANKTLLDQGAEQSIVQSVLEQPKSIDTVKGRCNNCGLALTPTYLRSCRARNVVSYPCGQKGHFQKLCKQPRPGQHNLETTPANEEAERGIKTTNNINWKDAADGRPNNNNLIGNSTASLKNDIAFNKTDNVWKPTRFSVLDELSEDEKMTVELYKRFRGILNKLMPQNFDTLMTQVQDLNIDTSERLQGIIDLVFEKAVNEPKFGSAYSSLCRELSMMQVPLNSGEGPEEFVNFRKLLVTRCQVEFEKGNANENLKILQVYEIENCSDPIKKKKLQTELEENERQLRRKSVGMIRFIGELFKQQMLTVSIMLGCLKILLQVKDEESLECLCNLLATVGEILDDTKQTDLNMIFKEIRDIVEKRPVGINGRIRFMLQDIIELRLNSWIPKKLNSAPTNSTLASRRKVDQEGPNKATKFLAYVPQGQLRAPGQSGYYRPTPPTNQRQAQQAIYPQQSHQFVSMSIPHTPVYINAPAVPYYNNTPRPATNFVSSSYQVIGQHLSGYASYAAQPPTQPQPQYYYNAAMMSRPPQQVPQAPQNAAQPPPTANIPIPQPLPQHGTHTKNKRRSNAIPIIDPSTGRDRLNKMYEQEQDSSHPPSGESSTKIYQLPPQAVQPRIDIVSSKLQCIVKCKKN